MISGDHLLGRTVLFFDHGHSPDPVGEFLASLDEVEPLDVDLCLPGHGRPFRDPEAKIAEARRQVDELLGKVREALGRGREDRLRDRRRDRRPRERQHAGQRLGPADRPLLPRPPGDRSARSSRSRGPTRSAGRSGPVACSGDGQLHLRARDRGARRRSSSRCSPTTARYAEITPLRKSELEREGEPAPNGVGAIRVLRAVGPPLREEVIAYEPPSRFSYKLLSGLPVRDHVGTVELTPERRRHQDRLRGAHDADRAAGRRAVVVGRSKQGIKQLLDGVANESERRAAANG